MIVGTAALIAPALVHSQTSPITIAVPSSLGGHDDAYGRSYVDGVRLAVDEANRAGGPRIVLETYNDRSSDDRAPTRRPRAGLHR